MQSVSGKQVLITGASAGIGRACAVTLARAGAKVLATGRNEDELARLKNEVAVRTIAGDLNDARFAAELASAAREVDILVSNAGVLRYAPILDITDEDCEWMFRTNVLAAFRLLRLVSQQMVDRRGGHIIVMSSVAAREVYPLANIYCATKHALCAITRALRVELQGHGIKVTEIAPGMVDTEIRATSTHPRVLEAIKNRKFGPLTPQEVAEAVLYAAQADANCCPDLIELRPRGSA